MTDDLRLLRTPADHAAALKQVARLMDAPKGRADADRLGVLAVLIADYERRTVSLPAAAPIETLTLEMKLKGRTQADLARVLGSRSRASELLASRRALTPAMADRVAAVWGVPRELLGPATAAAEQGAGKKPRQRGARAMGAAVLAAAILGLSATGLSGWALSDLPSVEPLVAAADEPDLTPLADIPLHVRQAFLAAEDADFYAHDGTSIRGLARASVDSLVNALEGRRPSGGGSITHQLVKNTLLAGEPRSLRRKLQQIVLAGRLEAALPKDRIIELYLNRLYFGDGTIGLAAASRRYFGREPSELTLAQAASLAAMPPAPNALRVDRPENAERAQARRDWVLARMETEGYLTAAALSAAQAAPLR
jgi:penicillin-binding protein 1A